MGITNQMANAIAVAMWVATIAKWPPPRPTLKELTHLPKPKETYVGSQRAFGFGGPR